MQGRHSAGRFNGLMQKGGLIKENALDRNGKTMGENCRRQKSHADGSDSGISTSREGLRPVLFVLGGNLFDTAPS